MSLRILVEASQLPMNGASFTCPSLGKLSRHLSASAYGVWQPLTERDPLYSAARLADESDISIDAPRLTGKLIIILTTMLITASYLDWTGHDVGGVSP